LKAHAQKGNLCHLDLEPVRNLPEGLYRRRPRYHAEAILRSMFFMDLRRMKFRTELERDLDKHPDEGKMLCFPVEDGRAHVTTVKNLWHLDRIRMGGKWDDLFRLLRDAVVMQNHWFKCPKNTFRHCSLQKPASCECF